MKILATALCLLLLLNLPVWAAKKITDLPDAASVDADDEFECVDATGPTSEKCDGAAIQTFVLGPGVAFSATAPANSLVVEATTGDVGIRTASPAVPLHVVKATASEIARFENSLTGTPAHWISLYDTGGRVAHWGMGSSSNDDLHFMNDTATGKIMIGTQGVAGMTFDSDNSVIFADNVKVGDILTLPVKGTAPSTCAIGEFYVDGSGAACACSAVDTWSNMHGTGTCV